FRGAFVYLRADTHTLMKRILLYVALTFVATQMYGQKNIVRFFPAAAVSTGGDKNVQELVKGYITPITEDFGSLINNGWYNTAATHKRFGFDLTVTLNSLSAKSDEQRFITPTLSGVQFDGTTGKNDKAPTAYGPEKEFPNFHYTSGPNNGKAFQGPDGGINKDVPIGSIVVPTIQAGIGLFANTDLRIRYTPKVTVGDNDMENWGVGVHHDIKQHIPGMKELPFSLAVFVAYSQSKATADLSGEYSASGTTQEGIGETSAFTAQVMISKKLAIVTFYGAVGYNGSKTEYSIKGSYLVDHAFFGGATVLLTPVTLSNPFTLTSKLNGVRATGGLRINLGPVIMNGDYSFVNAKGMFSAGFGFTVR
ncbi:MAG TPA: DUF6588 family protein, partial [Cyclobacteriaceae bacterium]